MSWQRARCISGTCVEVDIGPDHAHLRSTTDPDRTLTITRPEWDAFTAAVKAGDFDPQEPTTP